MDIKTKDFKKIYTQLIKNSIYDYKNESIGKENADFLWEPLEAFCARQVEKFDSPGEDKHGCCLNFSLYLLAKFDGIFMTCKDKPTHKGGKPTIHCAFLYEENGKLFVADPAVDKMNSNKMNRTVVNNYRIPLSSYDFPMENQQYTIYPNITKNSSSSFIAEFKSKENRHFASFKDLESEDIQFIIDLISEQNKPEPPTK